MKSKIKSALREIYGEFNTQLELKYEEKITHHLLVESWESKIEWATYNQVMFELKYNIKDDLKVKELQYWLTDDKTPKIVCIEIIEDVKDRTPELQRLYEKIKNF